MQNQDLSLPNLLKMTFHFTNGKSESFDIYPPTDPLVTRQDIRQVMRHLTRENWWILKTPERTIFINTANVLSVELTPPIDDLEGEGILYAKSGNQRMQ